MLTQNLQRHKGRNCGILCGKVENSLHFRPEIRVWVWITLWKLWISGLETRFGVSYVNFLLPG